MFTHKKYFITRIIWYFLILKNWSHWNRAFFQTWGNQLWLIIILYQRQQLYCLLVFILEWSIKKCVIRQYYWNFSPKTKIYFWISSKRLSAPDFYWSSCDFIWTAIYNIYFFKKVMKLNFCVLYTSYGLYSLTKKYLKKLQCNSNLINKYFSYIF